MAFVLPSARPRLAAALLLIFVGAVCNQSGEVFAQAVFGDRLWIGAESLHWQLDGSELPPLVTAGPATEPLDEVGQLDNPTTEILSGNETVGDDWRSGYRLFGGIWVDECHIFSLAADYFDAGDDDYSFFTGPDPNRIITRPFFNTETGEDDAELVSVPDELDGTIEVSASDEFQGAGVTLQQRIWRCCDPCGCGPSSTVNMLGGYRHYDYDSHLVITENLTVLPNTSTPLVPGTQIFVEDRFTARNKFHGGEFGFQGFLEQSWWWFDGLVKVAVGSHRRVVTIDGETINTVPNAGSAQFVGGLLTSEVTNIGTYRDRSLAVIPQFRVGAGCNLWEDVSVRAGYNVIVWNAVARAASQLPPGLEVDPRNLPPVMAGGGPEPEFDGILGSHLVAHGFDFGIQWSF